MKRYLLIALSLLFFFLVVFAIVAVMEIPLLQDASFMLETTGFVAALSGILLLVSDVFLPVPGNLIMVANGAIFGPWAGTLLSLIGGMGASWVGFLVGRYGERFIHKFTTGQERTKARNLLARWGLLAIVITRPIPLVSETVAVLAGTSRLPMKRMVLAAALGNLPAALIYSLSGVYSTTFADSSTAFLFVMGFTGVFLLIGVLIKRFDWFRPAPDKVT